MQNFELISTNEFLTSVPENRGLKSEASTNGHLMKISEFFGTVSVFFTRKYISVEQLSPVAQMNMHLCVLSANLFNLIYIYANFSTL